MKEPELWRIYVARNPSFEERETITLKAWSLRKLVSESYRIGYEEGVSDAKKTQAGEKMYNDIFNSIWGKKK